MTEFTGERVIPGEVNDDLWAEHISRYALASRYASQANVLDIGTGTGYGAAELAAHARFVTGVDAAPEAVRYAATRYRLPNLRFAQASATALPFANGLFDLATAFEVIEHLAEWKTLLAEAQRVLRDTGVLLVSTPNKLYYAESRAQQGPNPFHEHEFEFSEFRAALAEFFPHVTVLLQNRLESFSFSTESAGSDAEAQIAGEPGAPEQAHFFLAVCSRGIAPNSRAFLYVPAASNLLREREQHIRLLTNELDQNQQWLATAIEEHKQLLATHRAQTAQLEERNGWALRMEAEYQAAMERVARMMEEVEQIRGEVRSHQARALEIAAQYEQKVAALEQENREKTAWALETERRLSADLAAKGAELVEAVRLLDLAEATVIERTLWAQQLQAHVETMEAQLRMIRDSRWVRLGRAVGVGPRVDH